MLLFCLILSWQVLQEASLLPLLDLPELELSTLPCPVPLDSGSSITSPVPYTVQHLPICFLSPSLTEDSSRAQQEMQDQNGWLQGCEKVL